MADDLKIDWATHEAAAYACRNRHYSRSIPAGKLIKIGVWEKGEFVGAIIFGRGANNNLGKPYGLKQTEVCELVRIALGPHTTPVTRLVSIALKFLKKNSPGIRLIISYADPAQGHHGGIYQGGNWAYVGKSQAQREVMYNGRIMHKRTANALFGTIKGMKKSPILWKHKYLYALDPALREKVQGVAKPYPKRAESSENGISGVQPEGDGANPISALQGSENRSPGSEAQKSANKQ